MSNFNTDPSVVAENAVVSQQVLRAMPEFYHCARVAAVSKASEVVYGSQVVGLGRVVLHLYTIHEQLHRCGLSCKISSKI